jgi:hypothetical protein
LKHIQKKIKTLENILLIVIKQEHQNLTTGTKLDALTPTQKQQAHIKP